MAGDKQDKQNKRKVLVEVSGGVAEVGYAPPDVDCAIFDYDNAGQNGEPERDGAERRAKAYRREAEELTSCIVDEEAAVELLCECWDRFEREDDRRMMAWIDRVLDPVTDWSGWEDEKPRHGA